MDRLQPPPLDYSPEGVSIVLSVPGFGMLPENGYTRIELPDFNWDTDLASGSPELSYSRRRRQQWAVLLRKVWDIDALECPKCGGEMQVVFFIEDPPVIKRILKHLDLREEPRPPPLPLELACEPCTDYVPWQDDVSEIEVG